MERKAIIQKWAAILAPETQRLVGLAFGEGFGKMSSAQQSRSLLDFAPSTPALADQVGIYLKHSPSVAFAASELLYDHHLLTDVDKRALLEWRPKPDRDSDLISWAMGMSSFGMLDGIEIAKEVLATDPLGETPEEIIERFGTCLEIVSYLGADASALLREIEALIANPKTRASGYLPNFEHSRDLVTGKQQRQVRYAKNGSGLFSPWLVPGNLKISEPDTSTSEPSPASDRPTGQKAVPSTPTEKSASPPLWIVVGLTILVVLSLSWPSLKKRN